MTDQELLDFVFGTEFEAQKKCSKCKETKHVDQFCKKSSTRDGLQTYCKVCSQAQSKDFRQANPDYYKQWSEDNPEYYVQYYKDRPGYYDSLLTNENGYVIYTITNPIGQVYVGVTRYKIRYRLMYHSALMLHVSSNGGKLSKVHESMYVHGVENHDIQVYRELGHVTKEQAHQAETRIIHAFQEEGYSMLNTLKLKKD